VLTFQNLFSVPSSSASSWQNWGRKVRIFKKKILKISSSSASSKIEGKKLSQNWGEKDRIFYINITYKGTMLWLLRISIGRRYCKVHVLGRWLCRPCARPTLLLQFCTGRRNFVPPLRALPPTNLYIHTLTHLPIWRQGRHEALQYYPHKVEFRREVNVEIWSRHRQLLRAIRSLSICQRPVGKPSWGQKSSQKSISSTCNI
jgi:hypothetical protein